MLEGAVDTLLGVVLRRKQQMSRRTLAGALTTAFLACIAVPVRVHAADPPVSGGKATYITSLDGAGGVAVQFSVDGTRILTAGKTDVQVWDAKTYKPIGQPIK